MGILTVDAKAQQDRIKGLENELKKTQNQQKTFHAEKDDATKDAETRALAATKAAETDVLVTELNTKITIANEVADQLKAAYKEQQDRAAAATEQLDIAA